MLAYIFLDRFEHIDEISDKPLRDLTKRMLADIVISWGYTGTPEDFYRKIKQAKALARAEDPQFVEFYKVNTREEEQEAADTPDQQPEETEKAAE